MLLKFDRIVFEVDYEPALKDEEKFVIIVVFVPMILTLHYTKPNSGIVHFGKRLVVPTVCTSSGQSRDIDQLQMFELDVHMVDVWIFCALRHMHCPFAGFDAVTNTGGFEICAKSKSPLVHPLPVNILARSYTWSIPDVELIEDLGICNHNRVGQAITVNLNPDGLTF
jgi:hypothetical protein